MNNTIKSFARKYARILTKLYYILMNNRVKGLKNNIFNWENVYFKRSKLTFEGVNNEIILGGAECSYLFDCMFIVSGSNNKVIIEDRSAISNLTIVVLGDNNYLHINKGIIISGKTELAVMEGTKLEIGEDCLFASDITFRTGDSHSVIDAITGDRVNRSKDIMVGDHVWIGHKVIILKGSVIGDNTIVASGAVLTGKDYGNGVAVGGNPAKIIKKDVSWLAKTI